MSKRSLIFLIGKCCAQAALLLLMVMAAAAAGAATVRGRLDRVAANGSRSPAVGVAVTIYNQQAGRSAPAYAGNDGMYYLYNVPPGDYYLQVWVSRDSRVPPQTYLIRVTEPYTDIAPIVVP